MKKRKFNFVDLIVVIAIIGLLAGMVYKFGFLNKENKIAADTIENRQFEMYVSGVRQVTIDGVHVGDKFYDEKTGTYLGEVKEVSVSPYTTMMLTKDGEYKKAEKIGYKDLYILLEGPVLEKENGYFAEGIVELKRNSIMLIYSKYIETEFKVFDIYE